MPVMPETKTLRDDTAFPKDEYQLIFVGRDTRNLGGISVFVRKSLYLGRELRALFSDYANTLDVFIVF